MKSLPEVPNSNQCTSICEDRHHICSMFILATWPVMSEVVFAMFLGV